LRKLSCFLLLTALPSPGEVTRRSYSPRSSGRPRSRCMLPSSRGDGAQNPARHAHVGILHGKSNPARRTSNCVRLARPPGALGYDATGEGKEGEGGAAGEESEGGAAQVPGGSAAAGARRSGVPTLDKIPTGSAPMAGHLKRGLECRFPPPAARGGVASGPCTKSRPAGLP
jgi:hypothetical protein